MRKLKFGDWILSILWPFLAIGVSLFNRKRIWALLPFSLYLGYIIAPKGDGVRVLRHYNSYLSYSIWEWLSIDVGGSLDYLYPLLMLFSFNSFTIYCMILSAVFMFLNILILVRVRHFMPVLQTQKGIFMLTVLFFSLEHWYLFGRWNIASAIFIYIVITLNEDNKKKYILATLMFMTHWSFVVAVPILLLLKFIKHRHQTHILFALWVLSFIVSINFDDFSFYNLIVPEDKILYLDGGYIESTLQSKVFQNWYVDGHLSLLLYFSTAVVFYRYVFNRYPRNKWSMNILNAYLIVGIVYNFSNGHPDMIRFLRTCLTLFVAWYASIYTSTIVSKLEGITFSIVAIFYVAVKINFALEYYDWRLVGSNYLLLR